MKTIHKIIIGDSRYMKEVPNESVHLTITSPPYWQLKDYGNGKQIGFNDNYEEYINNLNLVWNECYRVLHNGCRLCINIGDQFARSVYYGRYKVIPIRTEIIKFCESIDFDYMGAIIWQKVTTCNTTGGATVMGSFPYPRNGILKIDYEFILIFKKYGNAPKINKEMKEKSKLSQEEWNKYFTGHWNFPGEKQDKHLAMFPEELPKRLIKMFSFVGDKVLDPFLGSGTTSLVAKNLHRNSIGYEINEYFLPIIKEKLGLRQSTIFQDETFEIIKQENINTDFKEEIKKLPYIFQDPIKFDKKIDPRKLSFGSKIDNSCSKRETYYTVKEIISPQILILNNGLKIRLLGIKERPGKNGGAIQFLKEKALGQKVFIKFDTIKYDEENNLLCYLYLSNKTFLNAHLIRSGLVDGDMEFDYKYKSKFLSK
ncbi:MAG: DNA methylase N-4 [Candidatus Infernicultor aquiphilus]|uniref:Methyltransferase n=1 Tax=Candidatus Infernicultor aquiphilus TaxID=1805029 RepID=A0A1J5G2K6_9BACT|nr:site-specific DNA-methyltransferase [bacterium]OIP66817.1 MAG: DNA methylase N-4 [Candidatus Atribacteria bacterium CG2_30_33_13]PIU25082.1 MAG: DNA methylase N-4 [Candidatus Atribacteria bacterium CG08_land_8_20_14_0_20_33_29]PIW11794.1 MAG: DNA methylase N-4 [Candidatus Atribacteria bacterium CG17_big_fil_post_rev_8_21_14_2_50_34_11]PIX34419.1 MAG: DNA methylase N-4 [Candidatus Atribacteria bacterium CG_4_8_14_3_um_filter_34_18]PIY33841.1 MAG: DNA methylase N-4 [Candidatus Atribacteria ba